MESSQTYVKSRAAYPAERAAALAGVPKSTLHYWAREGIWSPSVSSARVKRWSYSDLLALRLIDWLRREKPELRLPRTSMTRIRDALGAVENLGERLEGNAVKVWVDPRGGLIFRLEPESELFVPLRKGYAQGLAHIGGIDLVSAWNGPSGLSGPDLVRPRPSLRIIPGKLSGEPHVNDTRIMTNLIAALRTRGLTPRDILELYPRLSEESVEEAIDLEAQLDRNLRPAA